MSSVAKRYAKAAFEATVEKAGPAGGDGLAAELQRFAAAYGESPALQEVLRNPVLKDQRGPLLDSLLSKLQVGAITARVIRLLADNDRVTEMPAVASEVEALADARAGRLRARVKSAVMPTEAQSKRIAQALEKRLGKPVALSVEVEPELMGGLVCQVGDLTFDSSLKRQFEILTERLGAHA